MTPTLKQIIAHEQRMLELRARTCRAGEYVAPRELGELKDLEARVYDLWPRRRAEMAGASELARLRADRAMRSEKHGQQGRRTDLVGELT